MFLVEISTRRVPPARDPTGHHRTDAAKAAGIRHLIYSSVADADKATGIPHLTANTLSRSIAASASVHHQRSGRLHGGEISSRYGASDRCVSARIRPAAEPEIQLQSLGDIRGFVAALVERVSECWGSASISGRRAPVRNRRRYCRAAGRISYQEIPSQRPASKMKRRDHADSSTGSATMSTSPPCTGHS